MCSPLYRIKEWPRLEGTWRIMNLQPPCHRQGCQPPHLILDQAAQVPIQPGLDHLHGQGLHSLSSLFQHLTNLIVKNFSIQFNPRLPYLGNFLSPRSWFRISGHLQGVKWAGPMAPDCGFAAVLVFLKIRLLIYWNILDKTKGTGNEKLDLNL